MHKVYMKFERVLGHWRVNFRALESSGTLREYIFADPDKIELLAMRGAALKDLASKQGLAMALRNGMGGLELRLNDEQYGKLKRPCPK
jgi:hypothetical protein